MAYIQQQDILDEIGGMAKLIEALDDDGDGKIDDGLSDRIIASACATVDGYLQGRYVTPLSPVPALAVEASLVFAMEKIYNRRRQGADEKNPYTQRATDMRQRLKRISDREESLDAAERPAFRPGAIVSKPSPLNSSTL